MSSTHDGAVNGQHPNAAVIAGLRETADWLEQHPELPEAVYVQVVLRSAYGGSSDDARRTLIDVSRAIGATAQEERDQHIDQVHVTGRFGPVGVRASASVKELGGKPSEMVYEPLLD